VAAGRGVVLLGGAGARHEVEEGARIDPHIGLLALDGDGDAGAHALHRDGQFGNRPILAFGWAAPAPKAAPAKAINAQNERRQIWGNP
jgi:hypothetical protein